MSTNGRGTENWSIIMPGGISCLCLRSYKSWAQECDWAQCWLGIRECCESHSPKFHADLSSVKNKMSKGDGMSFAEFSYPLMQAWDWWHMYHSKGIQMQIGGS